MLALASSLSLAFSSVSVHALPCVASSSLSATSPLSPYASGGSLLTPYDYFNASASDPAPFEFCPVFGPGDAVAERRGQWGLLKSRLHMGSGARVQRVIQKAMAGLPVTISVLGGSGKCNVHPWYLC